MSRLGTILAILATLVGVLSVAVFQVGYRQSLRALAQRGASDLQLAADRLTGQLQRYQDLAVLLIEHPSLGAVRYGSSGRSEAEALLLWAIDRTGVLNMAYVTPEGRILAAARPVEGKFPDYVQRAIARARAGALGTGHGLVARPGETPQRAYVFAAPRFREGGGVEGILLLSVNVELLEQEWRGDRPAVFFTDAAGEVYISNRSEILGWQSENLALVPQDGVPPLSRRQVAGFDLWRIDWGPYLPRRALHLSRDLPQVGMRAEALIDLAPGRRLAMLQAAVVALVLLTLGAVLVVLWDRRRALSAVNARLEQRVEARTAELKRAQDELVQAGKLSALGQMSAGLSHELNQPLMAIRQFAENGTLFLEKDKPERAAANLSRIAELAGRMGRIIRNLRAFARQEAEPARRIELGQVLDTALEMTEARIAKEGVALQIDRPAGQVRAMGGEVRLAQVLVNLITNAVDAMGETEDKRLRISLLPGARPQIRVADSGPGIESPEKIFDPFYSTKEVGASEGMGLGLSISYGLVQSFGGAIRGRNLPAGGAEFTVELDGVDG
ncbi:two-component system, NtrC family, C4-dicarboxylate transport sensor histidine kinase DctB [Pseudooceanicola antarcticus]|uniref:C4-dicarboxylate transport sensor protein DctB n=1 Tax=Pseudooceanicola antarcticus TaxID=1247613 RepID=A0A285J411_9RHOB|nr:ATP-binding protein [Pseudooceanicola antarcticus]PJE29847.1 C4-dicarboxylate ABC transporter [Pseudooceanicola antarcticus]SNY54106.1 two-component system, NtrC family, C4-dicarboxylate transport sensor histidine kinase DctB [Pseudooceanicola antarcticus]